MNHYIAIIALVSSLLSACDRTVPQTVVVRVNLEGASGESVWLVESDDCSAQPIKAGWYRDGLWIFR